MVTRSVFRLFKCVGPTVCLKLPKLVGYRLAEPIKQRQQVLDAIKLTPIKLAGSQVDADGSP